MSSSVIRQLKGRAVPVRGNDIDTDRIIPARFMKTVSFDSLGQHVFHDVRRDPQGKPTGHPFDDPRHAGAAILLANRNFGCGSSREHAPQALAAWGIRAVVAESFAEIFAGNCTAIGIPAVEVEAADAEALMRLAESRPGDRADPGPGGPAPAGRREELPGADAGGPPQGLPHGKLGHDGPAAGRPRRDRRGGRAASLPDRAEFPYPQG